MNVYDIFRVDQRTSYSTRGPRTKAIELIVAIFVLTLFHFFFLFISFCFLSVCSVDDDVYLLITINFLLTLMDFLFFSFFSFLILNTGLFIYDCPPTTTMCVFLLATLIFSLTAGYIPTVLFTFGLSLCLLSTAVHHQPEYRLLVSTTPLILTLDLVHTFPSSLSLFSLYRLCNKSFLFVFFTLIGLSPHSLLFVCLINFSLFPLLYSSISPSLSCFAS